MPMPIPPVGGMPCSSAWMYASSNGCASSSPAAASARWAWKRARWSSGSLSSVKALPNSSPPAKTSKRSTSPGSERCLLASGESSTG